MAPVDDNKNEMINSKEGAGIGTPDYRSMIRRIYKRVLVGLAACAGISAFWGGWRMPVSILVGGVLALANLRGLAWGVNVFLGAAKASKRLVLLSYLRLMLLFVIFGALIKMRLASPLGIIFGLTVVFTVILMEGAMVARTWRKSDTGGEGDDKISGE